MAAEERAVLAPAAQYAADGEAGASCSVEGFRDLGGDLSAQVADVAAVDFGSEGVPVVSVFRSRISHTSTGTK
jgi:hypothetical protein